MRLDSATNTASCLSAHVDVWPNVTTLLIRICLETEPDLLKTYSAQDQPSGLERFTGLQWLWLERRPMPGYLLASANQALAHIKTFRVASIPSSLAYFSIHITVGVKINDSDFGAALETLRHSYAAFHHIRRTCCKPRYSSPWFRNCMKHFTCMYS